MIKVYIVYRDGLYPYKLMDGTREIISSASKENIEECRRISYNTYYDTVSQATQSRHSEV